MADAPAVVAELLERHFRVYPRALFIASFFAMLAAWLLSSVLPAAFIWGWLVAFVIVNAIRVEASRRFLAARMAMPPVGR